MTTSRWNLAVSTEIDHALRMFLASRGAKKGDLSRFVEYAVKTRIFDLSAEQAKLANQSLTELELSLAVEEAVEWARRNP